MNATQAYDLLKDVPADEFITALFTDERSRCCAIGHLKRLTSENPKDYTPSNCVDWDIFLDIRMWSRSFLENKLGHSDTYYDITNVNDRKDIGEYNEPEPKDRVLHLLRDMIEQGY